MSHERPLEYKVKGPSLLRSILLRERLLRQQAEVMDYFQNQEAMKLFLDEIVEIAKDLPEEAVRKLMTRLDELQRRRLSAA